MRKLTKQEVQVLMTKIIVGIVLFVALWAASTPVGATNNAHIYVHVPHLDHFDAFWAGPCGRVARASWVCQSKIGAHEQAGPLKPGFVPMTLRPIPELGLFTPTMYNVFYDCTPQLFVTQPLDKVLEGRQLYVFVCKSSYSFRAQEAKRLREQSATQSQIDF